MSAALLLTLLLGLGCGGEPSTPNPSPSSTTTAAKATGPGRVYAPVGLGSPATPEEIAAWDLDVSPSGEGLPAGSGTVSQGQALYAAQCMACHGVKGEGGVGPKLIGPDDAKTGFGDDPKIPKTMANWWPYATTAYDYIRRAMPQHAPGSMTPDQTYALTAYLLAENRVVGADFVADAKTLPAVKMPTTVKFVPDDRDSSNVVR
ncbi:cytochrome c [Myxococcota bacterium]|nr:cytochrome c [Myxococcota bacterium]